MMNNNISQNKNKIKLTDVEKYRYEELAGKYQYDANMTIEEAEKRAYNDILKERKKINNKSPISWQRKTMTEILNTEYPEIKWVIPNIIPEGLTKIDGAPKVGKSWFALHLALTVANGGLFMNKIFTEKKEVLYLALEDNERRIKNRNIKQGNIKSDNLFIETPTTWRGGVAAIKSYIDEYPKTGLIIIDTLFKFSPIEDFNQYEKTYKPISILQEISSITNTPIVLIHHTRKGGNVNNGESWADEGMGSQGINGAVDSILLLQKKDGRENGTLRIKGRDVEERCVDIIFNKENCTWEMIGDSEIVKKPEKKSHNEILTLLKEAGADGMRTGNIAQRSLISLQRVSNILKELEAEGKVKNPSYGQWILSQ